MRDSPRRRRDDEPSGGIPLFPLILVVILAGLLLGGVLAHFFGGSTGTPKPAQSVIAIVTPPPTAAPLAILPSPSPSALVPKSPTSSPSPTIAPTPSPAHSPTSSPTFSPSPTPKPTLKPVPKATAKPAAPRTPKPQPKPTAAAKSAPVLSDPAATVVRSYLQAMAQGDRQAASAYLANGEPTESFLNAGAAIGSIRSTALGGSRYRVTADVRASGMEYYETFTLEPGPGGLLITDHYWIKPQ
jgi:outer membrane biosynthesis protein TonB